MVKLGKDCGLIEKANQFTNCSLNLSLTLLRNTLFCTGHKVFSEKMHPIAFEMKSFETSNSFPNLTKKR